MAGNQAYVFLVYILSGILIGIFFDLFRILRKSFKTPDIVTYIEDIIFWILTGIFLLYVTFKFNNGEIRAYIFLGLIAGITFYILLFSKHFVRINVTIISALKKIIGKLIKIIIFPFKIIRKVILKPISFIFINIKKGIKNKTRKISNTVSKLKKFKIFTKKEKEKKDFI